MKLLKVILMNTTVMMMTYYLVKYKDNSNNNNNNNNSNPLTNPSQIPGKTSSLQTKILQPVGI